MTRTQPKYWIVLIVAIMGLALVCTGLLLAAGSNPARFSLDPREDKYIHLFAVAGFVCTITGIGLLQTAVRHTTSSMPTQHRTRANIGVGIGFVLQLAGLFLPSATQVPVLIGLLLILASLPVFIWGAMNYAEGKGHSKWIGLVGLAGIIGFIILIVLPNQNNEAIPTAST